MEEVSACIRMVYDVYGTFGFENIVVKLSTRPGSSVSALMKPGIVPRLRWPRRWNSTA